MFAQTGMMPEKCVSISQSGIDARNNAMKIHKTDIRRNNSEN